MISEPGSVISEPGSVINGVVVTLIPKPSRIATRIVRSSRFAAIDELYPASTRERDTRRAFPIGHPRNRAPRWARVARRLCAWMVFLLEIS